MKNIASFYRRFRRTGHSASYALSAARTLAAFTDLETESVRIRMEPERENYFDVFGRKCISTAEDVRIEKQIERLGCWWIVAEYCDADGEWQHADSIGMCIYENPLSPFENCYVIDLMASALECAAGVSVVI